MLKFGEQQDDNLGADCIGHDGCRPDTKNGDRTRYAIYLRLRDLGSFVSKTAKVHLEYTRRWPMTASNTGRCGWRIALLGLGLISILGLTGCQIDVGGQTLPSPYYLQDDVQYFPPGAQFPLSREAAAQKAVSQENLQRQ